MWHTGHEFTLDFAATQPAQVTEGGGAVVVAKVVARLWLPPTVVFDLLRAISDNLGRYEKQYGPIKPLEPKADTTPEEEDQA